VGVARTGQDARFASTLRLPHLHLPVQVRLGHDAWELAFGDGVSAFDCSWQEEDLLLNLRGQVQQIHDLADARPADVAEPGEVRVAPNRALAQERIEADREGHQAGDARDAARFDPCSARTSSERHGPDSDAERQPLTACEGRDGSS